jgi:hypothetical protein
MASGEQAIFSDVGAREVGIAWNPPLGSGGVHFLGVGNIVMSLCCRIPGTACAGRLASVPRYFTRPGRLSLSKPYTGLIVLNPKPDLSG